MYHITYMPLFLQILVQEWPHNWPTFIEEIVGASKNNESICENSIEILKFMRFVSST
jgi:exportin-1